MSADQAADMKKIRRSQTAATIILPSGLWGLFSIVHFPQKWYLLGCNPWVISQQSLHSRLAILSNDETVVGCSY